MSGRARTIRLTLVVLLCLLTVPVASGYFTSPTDVGDAGPGGNASPTPTLTDTPGNDTDPVRVGGSNGITVVTIDATGPSQIVAYGPGGNVLYQDDSHQIYHDVDPVPGTEATVEYIANNRNEPADNCPGPERCMLNVLERVNVTTGEETEAYSWYTPMPGSAQVHDVDRVNESVLLVADISFPDGVYMVNTTTDEVIWRWNVSEDYSSDSGGDYPGDWTHINDVEYLPDGRVMANLRNQDQVVFLEPGEGLIEDWTLGEDGNHDILYEQHNADYIPAERGGPAVIVADSENDRVVEYQRSDGEWKLSWLWKDAQLSWPRDADRLPNGNTLIVDSHGQRIFEVDPNGTIVWKRGFPDGGYDAERLGTGDESSGGYSMQAIQRYLEDGGSPNGTPAVNGTPPGEVTAVIQDQGCDGLIGCIEGALTDLLPSILLHGTLFALPLWVTPLGGAAFTIQVVIVVGWAAGEVAIRRDQLIARIR